jgi:hypothetical protein
VASPDLEKQGFFAVDFIYRIQAYNRTINEVSKSAALKNNNHYLKFDFFAIKKPIRL